MRDGRQSVPSLNIIKALANVLEIEGGRWAPKRWSPHLSFLEVLSKILFSRVFAN